MKKPMSDNIAPGERRELRSVVRGQFKVLRAEVKRREAELKAEIEAELVQRYRAEDDAVAEARKEVGRVIQDAARELERIGADLHDRFPDLSVSAGFQYGNLRFNVENGNRAQIHRALVASIPDRIGDANLALDRQENGLLRKLSVGALETDEARAFLDEIPTVGELVPRARLREIEQGAT